MEMRTTSYHLSFLAAVQLQVTTMPRNLLISGNGNANDHASQLRQLQGTLVVTVTTLGF